MSSTTVIVSLPRNISDSIPLQIKCYLYSNTQLLGNETNKQIKQYIFPYYCWTTNLKIIWFKMLSWLLLLPWTNQKYINILGYTHILDLDFLNLKKNVLPVMFSRTLILDCDICIFLLLKGVTLL